MSFYVRVDDTKKAFDYVNKTANLFGPNFSISGNNINKFETFLYVLGNLLNISGFPINDDHKRRLIEGSIKRFSKYRKKSYPFFVKSLKTEWAHQKKLKLEKYFVVLPWNVKYSWLKAKRHFIIDNQKILIRSFKYATKHFEFEKPLMILKRNKRLHRNARAFSYLVLVIYAKNFWDASLIAHANVKLLSSLFLLSLEYDMVHYQIGRPSPISKIGDPRYIFIFDNNRKYVDFTEVEIREEYYRPFEPIAVFRPNILNEIAKLVKKFEKLKSNKLKNLLADSLLLYCYALQEAERSYAFLHFWQILELIGLQGLDRSMDKMKTRIKSIFKKDHILDTIDALFAKRNQLVHEGKLASFNLYDVNRIKLISEACIMFLFAHVNKIEKPEKLIEFFDNIKLPEQKINAKIAVCKYIKKIR